MGFRIERFWRLLLAAGHQLASDGFVGSVPGFVAVHLGFWQVASVGYGAYASHWQSVHCAERECVAESIHMYLNNTLSLRYCVDFVLGTLNPKPM